MDPRWKEAVSKIRNDTRSGASELCAEAASVLKDYCSLARDEGPEGFLSGLTDLCVALMEAQPSMAPILRLANDLLIELESLDDLKLMRSRALRWLEGWRDRGAQMMDRIARCAFEMLQPKTIIVTYSYSSSVLKALSFAAASTLPFTVALSEGRPMNEGLKMAGELSRLGVKTLFMVDSLLFSFVEKADLIMVGADAITMKGLINKAGTLGLAVMAKETGRGFYALCGTDKLLPSPLSKRLRIPSRPAEEILRDPPHQVEPINLYFDHTPLRYLTAVVTEQGRMEPEKLKAFLRTLKVSKRLIEDGIA